MMAGKFVDRVFNFSAGPAVMPLPVLEQAQRDLLALPGCGASVLEISHRSAAFTAILEDAETRLRALLQIPDNYRILFLQGGSRLQFSMVPMNLLRGGQVADFIITGSWGKNAHKEAVREGQVNIAWDGQPHGYDRIPAAGELELTEGGSYVYFTSNETIQGVQFDTEPATGDVALVCDASSDFLSRPVAIERHGLLYACAQKNAGPAGVTVVIIRDDLLECSDDSLPGYLNYRSHAEANSLYNTPTTFAIYCLGLVARWIQEDIGGLEAMASLNQQKARLLYDAVDRSDGFYAGHAQADCRSLMNVTFRLPTPELESAFIEQAKEGRMESLKGHRSVGGIRASIYNAMPLEGAQALASFMDDFRSRHK